MRHFFFSFFTDFFYFIIIPVAFLTLAYGLMFGNIYYVLLGIALFLICLGVSILHGKSRKNYIERKEAKKTNEADGKQ